MASGDTRKVILKNKDNEYLIPYTEVASSSIVGRVKPDGTSTSVDANGVISVIGKQDTISDLATIRSGAAAGATAVQPSGVGNAEIEIQKNGTKVDSFTTNQSGSKKTINITVPTSASDVSALPSSTKYGASITVSLNTTDYKLTTTLKDQDGNTLGTAQVIDFPIESVVVNGSYDSTNKKIILTLQNGNTIDIPVGALISGLQSEITSSNKLDADLVDDSTSTHKFVTATNKTTWDGKQDAISDLATIRSGASAGATALQPNTAITGATKCKITYDSNGLVTGGADLASSDVTTALGYTPYNSTNPSGYQANVIETVKVNGTVLTPSSKAVDVSVPTESTVSGWGFTKNTGTVTSVNNVSPVNGNVSLSIPTVDQTYDATSANAQSGIAIAGAGFLKNTATGSNALTIGGTASAATSALNIGATSTAGGGYSVAVGYYAASNGARTTSIGYGARIGGSTADAIQIGNGTNSTAKSLSIGFYNTGNYQLLDGTTGLIPSDRIPIDNSTITVNSSGQLIASGGGSVNVDNKSITTNLSDEIQAIGVINSRDSSTAIKTWTGTKAQYDGITTKDSSTLYNITDDTDVSLTILEALYPVGSVYITTASSCPLSALISGSTWTQETCRQLVEKKEPTDNDPSWYNLYSDGWCEQGGANNSGSISGWQTVYFIKSYSNTDYYISVVEVNSTQRDFNIDGTHSDYFRYEAINVVGNKTRWYACGYTSTTTSHKQFRRIA